MNETDVKQQQQKCNKYIRYLQFWFIKNKTKTSTIIQKHRREVNNKIIIINILISFFRLFFLLLL